MKRATRRTALAWTILAALWAIGGLWITAANAQQTQPAAPAGDAQSPPPIPGYAKPLAGGDPMGLGRRPDDLGRNPIDPAAAPADPAFGVPVPADDAIKPGDLYAPDAPASPFWGVAYNGMPTYENRVVPTARAQDVFARQTYVRTKADVAQFYRNAQFAYERSREYTQASAESKSAYDALGSARAEALRVLDDNDEYQATLALRDAVAERIFDEKSKERPDPARLRALAAQKLAYSDRLHAAERSVLGDEPAVSQALDRLRAAGDRLAALDDQYEYFLRSSPELLALKERSEDFRIARLVTAAYLQSSIYARNRAFRYAVLSRGLDRTAPIYGGFGGHGYGGLGVGGNGGFGTGLTTPVVGNGLGIGGLR